MTTASMGEKRQNHGAGEVSLMMCRLASSPRGETSAAPMMKVHRSLPHNVTSNFRPPSWPGGGCVKGRRGGALASTRGATSW